MGAQANIKNKTKTNPNVACIPNNLIIEDTNNANEIKLSYVVNRTYTWIKIYGINTLVSTVLNDFIRERPSDFPRYQEIVFYIDGKEMDIKSRLLFFIQKGSKYSEQTFTYQNIGLDDFPSDMISFLKHENYYVGKPFCNPFSLLIFSRKDKAFSVGEIPRETIINMSLNDYSNLSSYCNGSNHLFISGGETSHTLCHFWSINLATQNVEKHPKGIIPKKNHSMIYIPKKYVFMIGGNDKKTIYYNIQTKEFGRWGDMNKIHDEPALAIIDNKYLYAFSNGTQTELMFERTNLRLSHQWEAIKPLMGKNVYFNQRYFGVSEDKNESVIFLGGNILDSNQHNIKYCFSYNYRLNKLGESKTKFEDIDLAEKSFMPFNSKFNFIIPNLGKNKTRLLIYDRIRSKIDPLSFEPRDYDNDVSDLDGSGYYDNYLKSKETLRSMGAPLKYMFTIPRPDGDSFCMMNQSQISNDRDLNSMHRASSNEKSKNYFKVRGMPPPNDSDHMFITHNNIYKNFPVEKDNDPPKIRIIKPKTPLKSQKPVEYDYYDDDDLNNSYNSNYRSKSSDNPRNYKSNESPLKNSKYHNDPIPESFEEEEYYPADNQANDYDNTSMKNIPIKIKEEVKDPQNYNRIADQNPEKDMPIVNSKDKKPLRKIPNQRPFREIDKLEKEKEKEKEKIKSNKRAREREKEKEEERLKEKKLRDKEYEEKERDRIKKVKEQKEKEQKIKEQKEKELKEKERQEQERIEKERKEKEERNHQLELQREKAQQERLRKYQEKKDKEEKEQKAKEQKLREQKEKEQKEREQREKEEQEREQKEREQREKEQNERDQREQKEREQRENEERENDQREREKERQKELKKQREKDQRKKEKEQKEKEQNDLKNQGYPREQKDKDLREQNRKEQKEKDSRKQKSKDPKDSKNSREKDPKDSQDLRDNKQKDPRDPTYQNNQKDPMYQSNQKDPMYQKNPKDQEEERDPRYQCNKRDPKNQKDQNPRDKCNQREKKSIAEKDDNKTNKNDDSYIDNDNEKDYKPLHFSQNDYSRENDHESNLKSHSESFNNSQNLSNSIIGAHYINDDDDNKYKSPMNRSASQPRRMKKSGTMVKSSIINSQDPSKSTITQNSTLPQRSRGRNQIPKQRVKISGPIDENSVYSFKKSNIALSNGICGHGKLH